MKQEEYMSLKERAAVVLFKAGWSLSDVASVMHWTDRHAARFIPTPPRQHSYLDRLALTARSDRVLRENGLVEESQIMALTRSEILSLDGAGAKTADEVTARRETPFF